MNRTPQLIVTLTPSGQLAVELPGQQATRRQVVLRDSEAISSLRRMLEAQAMDRTELGLDGAPTQAQVSHWERHQIWPDSRCRFCLAEGRATPDYSRVRVVKKTLVSKTNGVEVRIIHEGTSGKGTQRAKATAEELGL